MSEMANFVGLNSKEKIKVYLVGITTVTICDHCTSDFIFST